MRSIDSVARWWSKRNGVAVNGERHALLSRNGHSLPTVKPASEPQPLIELPWLKQLDMERIPRTLRYPVMTLGRLVDQAADRFGDNAAVVYNQQRWTYGGGLSRINRLAAGLARLGVRKGDLVMMALPNCPEYVL